MSVPSSPSGLAPDELRPRIDPSDLGFRTTDELEPLLEFVGQDRALKALDLGLSLRQRGYNIFVCGASGTGRNQSVRQLLAERAKSEPTPGDWVYVHHFEEPDSPVAFRLPCGHGSRLRKELEQIVERMRTELPKLLKAEDFSAERGRLSESYGRRSEELYQELVGHAQTLNMAVHRTPKGVVVFVPLKDGRAMEAPDFEKLTDRERAGIEQRQEELGEHVAQIMVRQQDLMQELRGSVEAIVRSFALRILSPLIARAKVNFPQEPLAAWFDSVRDHMLNHLDCFQEAQADDKPENAMLEKSDPWVAYRVNVVTDNSAMTGAPVVVEVSPSHKNLFGTIEREVNLFGRVSTDFTRIKPGSLLRANGGYLVIDLEDALTEPMVWKQLKRTLQSGLLLTEAYDPFALFTAAALKPQPIPVDTKVVAIGSHDLYYQLLSLDDDFSDLFKIRADFGDEAPRDAAGQNAYARFVAKTVRSEGLLAFDAGAVAELIRFGSREAGHSRKMSIEFGRIADLVREAHYWAKRAGARLVEAGHVEQALEQRIYRSGRIADKIREMIIDGALRVALTGTRVGQINGLPLIDLGDQRFGWPSRLTASVGVGQDGLVNIERECEMSGEIHNKGVLILEGYLRNRYARAHPLAISASLVFEQSYGWIEGDSASAAELLCLLSALADLPLRQDIAVTGSVNQHGEIQVVGGINEKIEGFFDVCSVKGLTETQGVCIPLTNVPNLNLRRDVIEAVAKGQFHIWAIDTIDEGLELLTGVAAGDLDKEGTFHYILDQRLLEILSVLGEQPLTVQAPRSRLVQAESPPPSPPALPGERG